MAVSLSHDLRCLHLPAFTTALYGSKIWQLPYGGGANLLICLSRGFIPSVALDEYAKPCNTAARVCVSQEVVCNAHQTWCE